MALNTALVRVVCNTKCFTFSSSDLVNPGGTGAYPRATSRTETFFVSLIHFCNTVTFFVTFALTFWRVTFLLQMRAKKRLTLIVSLLIHFFSLPLPGNLISRATRKDYLEIISVHFGLVVYDNCVRRRP